MTLLEVKSLSKSFFGVCVLENVSFSVKVGEVVGLIGENGAGKSTLLKILSGAHQPDHGVIAIDGVQVQFGSPLESEQAGISTVYQEFNLLADRTVAENIFLGREPQRFGFVQKNKINTLAQEFLESIGISTIRPSSLIRELSTAQQQIVEIAKAVLRNPKIIQMDEPTSSLAQHEVELLFKIIKRLRENGVSIIYVSHRLKEIFQICDRIIILKDGNFVSEHKSDEVVEEEVVRKMVGRSLAEYFPPRPIVREFGNTVLRLEASGNENVDGISFSMRKGEIIGIAGLQGAGRSELLDGLFGVSPFLRGQIYINDLPVKIRSPRHAIRNRVARIPEDRKVEGLQLFESIMDNCLAVVRSMNSRETRKIKTNQRSLLSAIEISTQNLNQEVRFLSGGNQQKVVIAKWLNAKPEIILFDEPTRGVDVGAKVAIYQQIRKLADSGSAVIMVSSELPELIGMVDRILVMKDGRLVCELPGSSTEFEILSAALSAQPKGGNHERN
jgi:ribose transport system ATP-binding protein